MPKDRPPTEQEVDESYPDGMDEYTCPVCKKTYHDEQYRPGWVRLNPHMRSHTEKEKEEAYLEYNAENLKEATIAIWRQQK